MSPRATAPCPACNAKTFDGSVCSRCGYAAGEPNRCPHCGSIAREEDGRCAMCGGPRIPGGFGGDRATRALREAKTHLGMAARRNAAFVGLAVLAAFSLVFTIGVALVTDAIVARALAFAITAFFGVFAGRNYGRARDATAKAEEAKGRAWLAAAEDVAARRSGGVTAEELGKTLAIEPPRAEELLTELAVHERTRIDVGDDAEVRYSVVPEVAARIAEEHEEHEEHEERDEADAAAPAKKRKELT